MKICRFSASFRFIYASPTPRSSNNYALKIISVRNLLTLFQKLPGPLLESLISVETALLSVPDEAVEEQRCVANDASGTGLLVLAALQGQAIVHVTFGVQARL